MANKYIKKLEGLEEEYYIKNIQTKKILLNLAQAYEAEFSSLTGKMPDKNGVFELDTIPDKYYKAYLFYYKESPIGFCIVNTKGEVKDIAEFYIIPSMRKKKLGYNFACSIFNIYPGKWQVRQIQEADYSINFWRYVISKYTNNKYIEDTPYEKDWGIINRQQFSTPYVNK